MHYEISVGIQHGKTLTTNQKVNPFFSEAPRIGGKTIRRGFPVKFTEKEMERNSVVIRRYHLAEAILIHAVDENGKKHLISPKPLTRTEVSKRDDERIKMVLEGVRDGTVSVVEAAVSVISERLKDELKVESKTRELMPVTEVTPAPEAPPAPEAQAEAPAAVVVPATVEPAGESEDHRKGKKGRK